jgi:hypothetical protein
MYANAGMRYCGGDPKDADNDGMPGINMINSMGGLGSEPGYNYIFPKEHLKMHVIYSEKPPWHNDGQYEMRTFHVPCNITVKELMQQMGCDNEEAKENALIELAQGADGRWYKGYTITGDSKDRVKKTLAETGWTADRNGVKEDLVWVWFCKEWKGC